MRHRIHYTLCSRRDLDEIWDYISSRLQNPGGAQRIVDEILDAVDQLAMFPELGTPLSSLADVVSDYRFLVTGNYLTFYRVQDSDIYVDRILYGRRDYLRILLEDPAQPY